MPRSSSRGGRNNNPSGRNQYSDWGVMEMVRERPVAAAAAAAGAAAAGLFVWSRRSRISQQLRNLSDQIGEWTENMRNDWSSGDDTAGLTIGDQADATGSASSRKRSSGRGMSETGGGNASLGAHSGGIGTSTTASPSGRGRARSTPTMQE